MDSAARTTPPAGSPAAPDYRLDLYNSRCVPEPFGLENTGVICYFNSLLQAVVSCPAVVGAAFDNRAYLASTATGRALYDYFWAAAPRGRPPSAAPFADIKPIGAASAKVLAALHTDLRARRPRLATVFGPGQQSASEALVMLLDMTDDPTPIDRDNSGRPTLAENPIARAFYHRYRARIYCRMCQARTSEEKLDIAVQFEFFHYDQNPPADSGSFSQSILQYSTDLSGYRCERCGTAAGAYRRYSLTMIPEVFVVLFNVYDAQARKARYFPENFTVPALGGGGISFRQVAQVQHFGNVQSGHYTARGSRALPGKAAGAAPLQTYEFNDMSCSPAAFGPADSVYLVFYHAIEE